MRHFRSPLDVFKGEEKHPVTLPELLSSSAAAALSGPGRTGTRFKSQLTGSS